ncbi:MAG: translation elongation factor 4, partial [Patescibacteria group bacterium]
MSIKIRNFCIIAHIDHGKSTLADRFLELTGTVSKREMKDQMLDQMDLERERGITIKLQPVRMQYDGYELNLIDTPGHVDFSYEVSRSLAAVEGAILLVDATQGIEAQTLANLYLAMDLDRVIIPVINKIDLPNADVPLVKHDLVKLLGCEESDILEVSAKTGKGVDEVLKRVITKIPAPVGEKEAPLSMLIFDSFFDDYRGVIAFGRVTAGCINKGDQIYLMASQAQSECLEVGMFKPKLVPTESLKSGEIGYVVTGLKEVQDCRVGDTMTLVKNKARAPLPGYRHLKPMVFAGIYCKEGDEYAELREAIGKMSLNDASLTFEPDHSEALGFGFRCGFLGILHLEIFQERIAREYHLRIIVTAPSVGYRIKLTEAGVHAWQRKDKNFDKNEILITSPLRLPEPSYIEKIQEPWMKVDIVTPSNAMG